MGLKFEKKYCHIRRTFSISTSGLKSDVTIMFLDPDFLKDGKISAIKAYIGLLNICMDFQDLLA